MIIGMTNICVSGLISNLTPVDMRMADAYVRIAYAPFEAWKKKIPMIKKKARLHDLSLTEIIYIFFTFILYLACRKKKLVLSHFPEYFSIFETLGLEWLNLALCPFNQFNKIN